MTLVARRARWFLGIAFGSWVMVAIGCSTAIGAGVGAVAIGAAVLTSGCYDAVDLRLIDGGTGARTCAARVTAVSTEGSATSFSSCYHAALPRGDWAVRAEQAGYEVASARVIVERGSSCEPAVQSLELVLHPLGSRPAPAPAAPAPAAPVPAPAAPVPAPPGPAPDVPPLPSAPVPAPPAPESPASPAPPSSVVPPSSAVPPTPPAP